MQTTTHTTTRTHTAIWLSDLIFGTIANVLADLGIDASRLFRDWEQNQAAIRNWIIEGSLAMVGVECHQPGGTVAPVFDFPVAYGSAGAGDAQFTAHHASLARFLAKLDRVPVGTSFALFCTFNGPHSSQPGWGPGTRASTDGLRSMSVGTIGTAPYASASMRYFR